MSPFLPAPARLAARCLVPLGVVCALLGCAPVQPWERGVLAKEEMSGAPYPYAMQSRYRAHIFTSKEATQGGHGGSGGGCGCN